MQLRQIFDNLVSFVCFSGLEIIQKSVRGHALVAMYVLMIRHMIS